jgi:hypothetical protein
LSIEYQIGTTPPSYVSARKQVIFLGKPVVCVMRFFSSTIPMYRLGGFVSIADIISAEKDEEVWLELLHFWDCKHMKEVIAKMEKDERCERSYKQSLDLLSPEAVFILGEFDPSLVSFPNKRIAK